ncbi:helix-turn-helix domain-containing protein [Flavobacteriaceae bacterium]|nr:helix-turn-helix domain-containing protein [Flavobacteriaceae bacterium]
MEENNTFLNYSPEKLGRIVASELKEEMSELVNQLLNAKSEDEEKPLSMREAAEFLTLSRTTFSNLVSRNEIPFKSLNPDNPKAMKLFLKKDLSEWLQKNRSNTIDDLRDGSEIES